MQFKKCIRTSAVTLIAFAASEHAVPGKDICSDTYMSEKIHPFATRARNAIGICGTAKAGVALYTESLRLVQQCLHDPGLRAYKQDLERLLHDAKNQASASCG